LNTTASNAGGLSATRPSEPVHDDIETIFKIIERLRDELVDLTRELIRFPTVNPPGEAYQPCAQFICSPGTYDQKHIDRVGKLKDCVAYGPGILDLAHKPDEYVVIEDMVTSAKVMALAAWSLLHQPA
jgi:acetylornithine deacetylase/succinyl-diaminopimelate desuccinylase-like protein